MNSAITAVIIPSRMQLLDIAEMAIASHLKLMVKGDSYVLCDHVPPGYSEVPHQPKQVSEAA